MDRRMGQQGEDGSALPSPQAPHTWPGWGPYPMVQWPQYLMQSLQAGQQLPPPGQAPEVQVPNTGVSTAIPFTGASPVSGQPYGWSPYGQLPLLGPLPIQPGLDQLSDRPRMS